MKLNMNQPNKTNNSNQSIKINESKIHQTGNQTRENANHTGTLDSVNTVRNNLAPPPNPNRTDPKK